MSKLKLILLLIVAAVLVDFAVENPLPRLELKLFKFNLVQLPVFLLAYISLALGLALGWVGHVLRIRKKKRQAAAALTQEKQAQESQQSQEAAS